MSLRELFVEGHRDAYAGWRELIDQLEASDWDRPTGCPGWSVRDNLAHVVGLERVMLGDPEPDHEPPAGLVHVRDELGAYMERHIDVRRGLPIQQVVDEFDQTVRRRLDMLDAMTEESFATADIVGVSGAVTTAKRFLGVRAFDMWAHQQDARRATRHPGRLAGPAAEVAQDRSRRAVLHYLPQRLADDDGVLVIELTGELPATWVVDLGSAVVLDDAPPLPRAWITMGWADFVPLGCGRSDAADPATVATVEGDVELGQRAVASLAFTP